MDPREMIFNLPQFEIKELSDKDWKKVSEKDFLIKLVDNFDLISYNRSIKIRTKLRRGGNTLLC